MRNRQLVVNSLYYTIGEILPRIISFFLLPLLTRYLSPSEYGINSYTNTVMLFSFVLSALSLNTFLLRNYYKEDSEEGRKKIIGSIFGLMLGVNAILTGLELLLFPPLLGWMKIQIPFHPFFLLAIINNFLDGFSIVPLVLYRIKKNARLFVIINASKTFLQFAGTFFLLTRFHLGLTGVYMARLFVSVPYAVLFLVIVYRNAIFSWDFPQMKRALAFSLPLLPGALSFLFISTFDRIVLEKNVGLSSLGLYSAAATLALTLNVVVQGLYRTFEQKIFEKHNSPEYPVVIETLYKYFIACLMTGGFVLSILSKEVFVLFTSSKYLMAYKLVPLLSVSVIIAGLGTFLGTLIIANQKPKIITKGTALSVLVTFAGTLILIRIMGVYGAIVTSIVSFLIVYFIYLWNLQLRKDFVLYTVFLLLVLLGISTGFQYLDIRPIYSIPVKAVIAAVYFWLCIFLLKIKLMHIEI